MKRPRSILTTFLLLALAQSVLASNESGASPDYQRLDNLLARTASRTSEFLDQFSDVKCTEHVRQEKLNKDEKVELKEDSTYDYLVILTNDSGELSLAESRIPIREAKKDRKNTSMLLSNGFATLFLVFHPYYAAAFKFTPAGEEVVAGQHAGENKFSARTGHEVACGAGAPGKGISSGTVRDRVDRPHHWIHREDRSRDIRQLAGRGPQNTHLANRFRPADILGFQAGILVPHASACGS
jgi:hypothetical protein